MEGYLKENRESGQDGSQMLVTTLHDLVSAVEEVIKDGEEDLVVRTVMKLIDSGNLRFHSV